MTVCQSVCHFVSYLTGGRLCCRAAAAFGTPLFEEMRDKCIGQDLSWEQPAVKWEAVLEELMFGESPSRAGAQTPSQAKASVPTPVQVRRRGPPFPLLRPLLFAGKLWLAGKTLPEDAPVPRPDLVLAAAVLRQLCHPAAAESASSKSRVAVALPSAAFDTTAAPFPERGATRTCACLKEAPPNCSPNLSAQGAHASVDGTGRAAAGCHLGTS